MASFPFYIARRYLVSKKSTNVINIISGISVAGMTIGTMALLIILSVFNGLDGLIKSLFSSFDPQIKISLNEGKFAQSDSSLFQKLQNVHGIADFCLVIEDKALIRYGKTESIALVKGVDKNYTRVSGLDTMLFDGDWLLKDGDLSNAIVGRALANRLNVGLGFINPLLFYRPDPEARPGDYEHAFIRQYAFPAGIFSVQQEIDESYILVPIDFARDLFKKKNSFSSIEIKLKDEAETQQVKNELQNIFNPEKYKIQDRFEQKELLYKTINSEKLIAFLIISFVLLIASFTIISSLSMLIINKKEDINILRALGASWKKIRSIFFIEGFSISLIGGSLGIILGLIFCFIQDRYGIIPLQGDGAFIVEYYPVKILSSDLLFISGTIIIIGFIAAWYPVRYLTRKYI